MKTNPFKGYGPDTYIECHTVPELIKTLFWAHKAKFGWSTCTPFNDKGMIRVLSNAINETRQKVLIYPLKGKYGTIHSISPKACKIRIEPFIRKCKEKMICR